MKTGPNFVKTYVIVLTVCLAFWSCSRQESSSQKAEKKDAPKADARKKTADSPEEVDTQLRGRAQSSGEPKPTTPPVQSPQAGIEGVSCDPACPISGDSLKAIVVDSGGGASGKPFSFRWKINGQVVQESESDVLSHSIKRGDFVELEVSPGGDNAAGKSVSSYTTVANAPPVLKLTGQNMGVDGQYEAQLEASDPEKDPVTFSLKSGPAGMTVDPSTGAIHWKMGPDVQGTFSVEVSARDSEGAETILGYQIKIRRESGQRS